MVVTSDLTNDRMKVLYSILFASIQVSTKDGNETIKLCDLGISKREADILISRAGMSYL